MKQSNLLNIVYRMLVCMLVMASVLSPCLVQAAEYTEQQATSHVSVYIDNGYIAQENTTPTEQVTPSDSNKQGKLPQTSEKQSYLNWLGWLFLNLFIIIKLKKKVGKYEDEIH